MQGQPNAGDERRAVMCTSCGAAEVAEFGNDEHIEDMCQSCLDKMRSFDEGARFAAFMSIGAAIRVIQDYGGEPWTVYRAVDTVFRGYPPEDGDVRGLHPDDAHALASRMDPTR